MADRSCTFSTDANVEKKRIFRYRAHPFDIDIQWWINFQEIQTQMRTHCDYSRLQWEGHCDQQSNRFLKLTSLLQVSLVTRRSSPVVVSKMCVASWLGWIRTALSETSFIFNRLLGAFRMSLIIQEMKIAEKKKINKTSVQQTIDGEQPTKSAANQHRIHEVICSALTVK